MHNNVLCVLIQYQTMIDYFNDKFVKYTIFPYSITALINLPPRIYQNGYVCLGNYLEVCFPRWLPHDTCMYLLIRLLDCIQIRLISFLDISYNLMNVFVELIKRN